MSSGDDYSIKKNSKSLWSVDDLEVFPNILVWKDLSYVRCKAAFKALFVIATNNWFFEIHMTYERDSQSSTRIKKNYGQAPPALFKKSSTILWTNSVKKVQLDGVK